MPSSVLGTGRGIDHMMIAVKDLRQATADYARLGFAVSPGGRHPGGTENAAAGFETDGYLELLAVYDANRSGARDIVDFLARQEGAMGVGLDTSSAELTASYLRGCGLDIRGPTNGTITFDGIEETPPVLWKSVEIVTPSPYLGEVAFFLEYDREAHAALVRKHPELAARAKATRHPNGVRAIHSFWLAVDDLESAARSYATVGLPVGPEMAVSHLQATGREVEAGEGSILLLQSEAAQGPVARFLELRKAAAGIMGTTLRVDNLGIAEQTLPVSGLPRLKDESDPGNRSLLIPPELAHGVWIELVEGPGMARSKA
jgi:catechol 2,3-dioxygenase-like lactoylglutathione lyase family enzyme